MISYKDMTFCSHYKDCIHQDECHRPLTEKVLKDAEEFGLPICTFIGKPDCHKTLEEVLEEKEV